MIIVRRTSATLDLNVTLTTSPFLIIPAKAVHATEVISNSNAVVVKICYCATPSHLVPSPIELSERALKASEKNQRRWLP